MRDPLVGDYRDLEALRSVAEGCSVVTFDHEHVPTEHLHTLTAEGHACRPGPHASWMFLEPRKSQADWICAQSFSSKAT